MLDGESSEYVRAVNSSLAFTLQARAFFFKGTSMLEALCGNYDSELGPEIMIFNIGPAWTESKANRTFNGNTRAQSAPEWALFMHGP